MFYQPVSFSAWTDFSQTESRDVILKMCWGNCFTLSSVKNYTIALWPQIRSHLKDKTLWFTGGGEGGVRFLWPALFCLFCFFSHRLQVEAFPARQWDSVEFSVEERLLPRTQRPADHGGRHKPAEGEEAFCTCSVCEPYMDTGSWRNFTPTFIHEKTNSVE